MTDTGHSHLSNAAPRLRAVLALFGLGAFLLLSACEEKERILPGVREDIRSDVQSPDQALVQVGDNRSVAIRLPGQQANAEWSQSFGTSGLRVTHPALRSAPQPVWSVPIGAGNTRRARITADPVVAGGLIYTLDSGARVSGVSTNGVVIWSKELLPAADAEGDATGGGMAYHSGTLYVSSGFGLLSALDAKTGNIRWQQRLEATGSGQPLVANGLIYLVAGDDTGWAIDIETGRIKWNVKASPSAANVLGAPAPVLSGDLAVFAFGSGDLVAVFRRGGGQRWSSSLGGERSGIARSRVGDITGSPVVVGRTIYVGNNSGRTMAFDSFLGDRIWTAAHGALGPVWPVSGSLFLVADSDQLVRLDARTGATVWAVDLPGNIKDRRGKRGPTHAQFGPILAGGRVIVPSGDGLIRFFAPDDGTLTNSVAIPGGAATGPVVAGKTLYVVGADGQLHAFR
ncbi:MAG: PQQ-like beta-propeller repeat protein [Rhodobacteraceae bacterium]|nr:PQQ-like beta-propeller repeat protein [Paracoccaceae bacterium]